MVSENSGAECCAVRCKGKYFGGHVRRVVARTRVVRSCYAGTMRGRQPQLRVPDPPLPLRLTQGGMARPIQKLNVLKVHWHKTWGCSKVEGLYAPLI